jgi:multidrug efflux pump subunit AcrB
MSSVIAWMARHPVAANLLMVLLLAAGLFNAFSIDQKVFPDTTTDTVEVSVEYRGASPVEILESVIQRIEEQVSSLDGIDEITATASEGLGRVTMVLDRGIDVATKVDEIRTEIDAITSFPAEAEQAEVRKVTDRERAVDLVIYGDVPERALKEIAYQTRDQLMGLPEVSFADVDGVRKYEVSVEISMDRLREYGLTLPEVAAAIRAESLELPAGTISSAREELGVRTLGRNYGRLDFEEIVLRVGDASNRVRLGDIATVSDGFQENDLISRFRDQPVATVRVFRVGEEQVLDVVSATLDFVESNLGASLPPGVGVYVWRNQAEEFESRLDLLKRNAAIACVLVLSALALFLNLRLAFWVSVGIAISFISAFTVMATVGVSLNAISAFGFILAVGIVVDDAIVTGEKIFELRRAGTPPVEAAVMGAQRMSRPVVFAVLTTIAAFTPLLTVPGVLGQVMGDIPKIVIIVLVLSLVESLLILPHHLAHARIRSFEEQTEDSWFSRLQHGLDRRLRSFVEGPLDRALRYSTQHWGIVIAAALSVLMLTFGILTGGYVKFEFFPSPEGRYVSANIELFEGTPVSRTLALTRKMQADGYAVAAEYTDEHGGEELIQSSSLIAGNQSGERSPLGSTVTVARPHVGSVTIELNEPEAREISAESFEQLWRQRVGTLEGVKKLVFTSSLFAIAEPVMVEISADNDSELEFAIQALKDRLEKSACMCDCLSRSATRALTSPGCGFAIRAAVLCRSTKWPGSRRAAVRPPFAAVTGEVSCR